MNVCSGHVNVVKWQYCTRTTCWAIIRINIAVKVMVRLFAKTRAKWLNRKLLWWILADIFADLGCERGLLCGRYRRLISFTWLNRGNGTHCVS